MYFNMDIKTKTRSGFQNSVLHNHRKEKEPKENIDYSRTKNNFYIIGSNDEAKILASHLKETENSRTQTTGKTKAIRKDANVAISFVYSASPEYFFDFEKCKMTREKWEQLDISNGERDKARIAKVWKTLKKDKVEEFKKIIIEHMKEIHKDNVINLQCHMDEKGVHFHGLVSCRVDSPKGKKLSAKEYYTRKTLADWNKDIRARMLKIGLEAKKEEPMPPIPTNEHHTEQAPELPKGTPRPKVQKPKKGFMGYSTEDVDKAFEIYEQREKALKQDNANLLKTAIQNNNYRVNFKNIQKQNSLLVKENKRMQNKIYKMTEQEKEDLRSIACNDVMEALGYLGKKEGNTTRYKAEGFNLVVTEASNKFFDNSQMTGGYGAIDLLITQFKYSFKEAIDFLSGKFTPGQIAKVASRSTPENVSEFLEEAVNKEYQKLPEKGKEFNLNRVKNYLTTERKISSSLIEHLIKNNLLYADRNNNCVFTNENKTFAFLRGTVANKKFVANKGKLDFIKYKFQKEDKKENVFLFESAIDALSFFTMTKEKGTYIVLNGSGMINKIDELNLQQYNKVYCCFDKDTQGQAFDDKIKKALPNAIVLKPTSKDFNQDLKDGNTTTIEQYIATRNLANAEAIAREAEQIARNSTDRNQQTRIKIS